LLDSVKIFIISAGDVQMSAENHSDCAPADAPAAQEQQSAVDSNDPVAEEQCIQQPGANVNAAGGANVDAADNGSTTGSDDASTLGANDIADLADVLDDTRSVTSSTAETVTFSLSDMEDIDDFYDL